MDMVLESVSCEEQVERGDGNDETTTTDQQIESNEVINESRENQSCTDSANSNFLMDKGSTTSEQPFIEQSNREQSIETSESALEKNQESSFDQSTEQPNREQIIVESEDVMSEKNVDSTQQELDLKTRQSLDFESTDSPIGECCTGMNQIQLSQHDPENDSIIDDTANHQNPTQLHEDSHTPQNDINNADSFITNNDDDDDEETNSIILDIPIIPSSSKEDSSCFDRESANGFLPVDSDSITTSHTAGLATPTRRDVDTEHDTDKSHTDNQFSTPLHQNTKRVTDDCSVLDYCDLTSPLEALYLLCSRGGGMLKKESMEELLLNDDIPDNATSPERYSFTHDVDPKGVAPLSPPDDRDVRPDDSDSDDDSSSAASVSSRNKFRIVDRDTGKVFDVREVMRDIDEAGESTAFDTRYSFLPSKRELQRRTVVNESSMDFADNVDEESLSVGPLGTESFDTMSSVSYRDSPGVTNGKHGSGTTKKKTKLSGLKSSIAHKLHKSSLSRKRTASSDTIPRNAIHVKSTSRQHSASSRTASSADLRGQQGSSSFNPMLLVKTIPKSHDGPAWCASFSLDGRFLATGGEDGNVCIWAVAPKSNSLHPDNIDNSKTKEETAECHSPKEEDIKNTDPVEIDSPLTLDSDDVGAEKVAIDTIPEDVPPLNFVGTGPELATNLEILSDEPLQRFKDHTADVIDLSWSHTNFLLTASLDSSVRLYHYSKSHCLHLFKHANLVASVAFHPNDERYFISGGIDKKLRLWSITDGRVKDWAQAPDVITAVRFTPDGKYAVAGLFRGQVYFYDSDGLKYCECINFICLLFKHYCHRSYLFLHHMSRHTNSMQKSQWQIQVGP